MAAMAIYRAIFYTFCTVPVAKTCHDEHRSPCGNIYAISTTTDDITQARRLYKRRRSMHRTCIQTNYSFAITHPATCSLPAPSALTPSVTIAPLVALCLCYDVTAATTSAHPRNIRS